MLPAEGPQVLVYGAPSEVAVALEQLQLLDADQRCVQIPVFSHEELRAVKASLEAAVKGVFLDVAVEVERGWAYTAVYGPARALDEAVTWLQEHRALPDSMCKRTLEDQRRAGGSTGGASGHSPGDAPRLSTRVMDVSSEEGDALLEQHPQGSWTSAGVSCQLVGHMLTLQGPPEAVACAHQSLEQQLRGACEAGRAERGSCANREPDRGHRPPTDRVAVREGGQRVGFGPYGPTSLNPALDALVKQLGLGPRDDADVRECLCQRPAYQSKWLLACLRHAQSPAPGSGRLSMPPGVERDPGAYLREAVAGSASDVLLQPTAGRHVWVWAPGPEGPKPQPAIVLHEPPDACALVTVARVPLSAGDFGRFRILQLEPNTGTAALPVCEVAVPAYFQLPVTHDTGMHLLHDADCNLCWAIGEESATPTAVWHARQYLQGLALHQEELFAACKELPGPSGWWQRCPEVVQALMREPPSRAWWLLWRLSGPPYERALAGESPLLQQLQQEPDVSPGTVHWANAENQEVVSFSFPAFAPSSPRTEGGTMRNRRVAVSNCYFEFQ